MQFYIDEINFLNDCVVALEQKLLILGESDSNQFSVQAHSFLDTVNRELSTINSFLDIFLTTSMSKRFTEKIKTRQRLSSIYQFTELVNSFHGTLDIFILSSKPQAISKKALNPSEVSDITIANFTCKLYECFVRGIRKTVHLCDAFDPREVSLLISLSQRSYYFLIFEDFAYDEKREVQFYVYFIYSLNIMHSTNYWCILCPVTGCCISIGILSYIRSNSTFKDESKVPPYFIFPKVCV